MNKCLTILFSALLLCCGCQKHEEVFFDTPFVRIEDINGATAMTVDGKLDNLLTEVRIVVCASDNYFISPVTVEYETIVGDGLTEGEDFRIQPSTMSPLTFSPGTYSMIVRVVWYKRENLDPEKDNTLTLRLKGTDNPDFLLGVPGPSHKKQEFIFTKL